MRRSICGLFLFGSLLVTQTPSTQAEAVATFQGLGDLPGGNYESFALKISSDGSTVVGRGSSALGIEAFRWTSATGMVGLGDLPGGSFSSIANGASADGSTVVGQGSSASGIEAFRWTSATGMVGLGDLPGGSFSSVANGISSDGSTVVGRGSSASGIEAFRWTSATGMVGLGDLPGGSFSSIANGASADGSTVVGYGQSLGGAEAFRWTSETGMVGLGFLSGGSAFSIAEGVSWDGSAVVGYSGSASGPEAFRWTSETGMVGLGFLSGGIAFSTAQGVSRDGSVVVGYSDSASGPEAFFWTDDAGMQSLASVLTSYGVSAIGFEVITIAEDIAVHGNIATIVGHGNSTSGSQAFYSTLPLVSASLADELLSLTPGPTSDTLALDVSATKLLYGDVGQYAFDFTTDGIDDLVLDVGTPLFDSYWDETTDSFLFTEPQFRNYYPGINSGSFGSLTFITTVRMTHENGTAINTSVANITFVPEVGPMMMLSVASALLIVGSFTRRRMLSVESSIT